MPLSFTQLHQFTPLRIEREFRVLEQVTDTFAFQQKQYYHKSLREYNRYTDILPFKDSRVELAPRPWPFDDTDYINASFVDVSS